MDERMATSKAAKTATRRAEQFGSDYYRRFYLTPATRAMSRTETELRGKLIAAAVKQLDLPVRRILDAGCGLGWFRKSLLQAFPRATYLGVEFSEYLCAKHGWTQGSVVDYRNRSPFDLQEVVKYATSKPSRTGAPTDSLNRTTAQVARSPFLTDDPAYRSISPITMSSEPTIAGTSAIKQPRHNSCVTLKFEKQRLRARARHGIDVPSLTK